MTWDVVMAESSFQRHGTTRFGELASKYEASLWPAHERLCGGNTLEDLIEIRQEDYLAADQYTFVNQTTEQIWRYLYVRYQDHAGNWSLPVSASIIFDTEKPTVACANP